MWTKAYAVSLGAVLVLVGCHTSGSAVQYAKRYQTDETEGAVLGTGDIEGVERALLVAGREAGVALRGDGRLALLAARFTDASVATPEALRSAARELGMVDGQPVLYAVAATPELLAATVARKLGDALRTLRPTHFGAFVHDDGGESLVVLSYRPIELSSVTREVRVGASARLRGALLLPSESVKLEVRGPTRSLTLPLGSGPKIDARVAFPERGEYRLQIIAMLSGKSVCVAELLVYAGIEPVATSEPAATADNASAVEAALATRVAALRAHSEVPALAAQARLRTHASKQANDLARGVTTTASGPDFASGLSFMLTARGADAQTLFADLTRDTTQRAALVNASITHVGVGLSQTSGGWVAVVALAALAQPTDTTLAAARLLAAYNEHRQTRGVTALRPDANLSRAAQHAAKVFLAQPAQTEQALAAASDAELSRLGLAYRKVATVVVRVRDPFEASALEPALAAEVSAVGVAVVESERGDLGAPSIVVILVLGWDR